MRIALVSLLPQPPLPLYSSWPQVQTQNMICFAFLELIWCVYTQRVMSNGLLNHVRLVLEMVTFFFTINSLEWVSAMNSLVFSHPSLLSIFIFTFPPPSTKHASPSCSNIFAWNNIQNKLLLRMNRETYISSSVKYSLFFCCCCLSLRVVCCWLLLAGSDENAKCDSGLVSVIHFRNAKGAKLWFITLNLKNLLFKVGKVKMGMAVRWLSIKGKSYCMLFDWWVV